ncbi:MAG: ribbon-helix-helix protein, CopG family [Pirellulales bacterium]|nr:ribbon-helix-helix protein, CopG family [Pirellulales bacterium]
MNSQTIAFRVKQELLQQLDEECRRLNVTRSDLVRAIVEEHFAICPARLAEEISKLHVRLKLVHRNQARSLVTLLTAGGQISLEDAKTIARSDLLS